MGSNLKQVSPSVPFQEYVDKQMQDPEFARILDELQPEFELVEQVIALRLTRQMTQADLAAQVGTSQSSIARLEGRGRTKDLKFLTRVAEALGARLEIRLVPKEEKENRATTHDAWAEIVKPCTEYMWVNTTFNPYPIMPAISTTHLGVIRGKPTSLFMRQGTCSSSTTAGAPLLTLRDFDFRRFRAGTPGLESVGFLPYRLSEPDKEVDKINV